MAKKRITREATPKNDSKEITLLTDAEKFSATIHKKFSDREERKNNDLKICDDESEAAKFIADYLKNHDSEFHFNIEAFSTSDGKIHVHARSKIKSKS